MINFRYYGFIDSKQWEYVVNYLLTCEAENNNVCLKRTECTNITYVYV